MSLQKFINLKTIIILILLINNLIFYFLYKISSKTIDTYESTFLEKNIRRKIVYSNQKVKILYRDREVIKTKEVFVPQEGKIIVVEKEKTNSNRPGSEVEIKIIDKGFSFRPGFGIIYDRKLYPEIDLKLVYYKRYGITMNLYKKGLGFGIVRNIDDLSKDLFLNSQLMVGYNLFEKNLYVGIRTNF